jgi:cytochrome P450
MRQIDRCPFSQRLEPRTASPITAAARCTSCSVVPHPRLIRSPADDKLGDYHIPAGATVTVSPYLMHRHSAFWEQPERFDPERFAADRSVDRPRFAYIPFGGEPRQCIGNTFALVQAQLILAMVAQTYTLQLVPGYPVEPYPRITLQAAPRFADDTAHVAHVMYMV